MARPRPEVFTIELHDNNDHSRPSPPVYYPGSTIAGNVVIESSRTMKPLHQITVKLKGSATVNWEGHIIQRQGRVSKTVPVLYSDTENTMDLQVELWDVAGNRTTADGKPRQLEGLPPGKHIFPFQIQMPSNLDITLPSSLETSEPFCFIRYLLIAGISQTKLFQFDHKVTKVLSVSACIDVNVPKLLHQLSGFQKKATCCIFSSTSITVQTDRCGYCPGESIAINVEVENPNSTARNVRAMLKQKIQMCGQPYLLNGKALFRDLMYKTTINVIKTIEGPPNWRNKLLAVPITPPTIAKCRPIKVSYTLEVSMNNLCVKLPIVIGTIPYRGPEGSSMATPDDLTAIDFVRENYIQYQTIQYASRLDFTPFYGYIQHYRFAPAEQ